MLRDFYLWHQLKKGVITKDARIICFLWDHTRSTQEHAKFGEGVLKMEGMDGCVVDNSPSMMD